MGPIVVVGDEICEFVSVLKSVRVPVIHSCTSPSVMPPLSKLLKVKHWLSNYTLIDTLLTEKTYIDECSSRNKDAR